MRRDACHLRPRRMITPITTAIVKSMKKLATILVSYKSWTMGVSCSTLWCFLSFPSFSLFGFYPFLWNFFLCIPVYFQHIYIILYTIMLITCTYLQCFPIEYRFCHFLHAHVIRCTDIKHRIIGLWQRVKYCAKYSTAIFNTYYVIQCMCCEYCNFCLQTMMETEL